MSNRFATHVRVHCISACLLAVLTPRAWADDAPRPVPIIGTEAEFSGHLMGADCARWTTAGLTPDGILLRTCQGYTIESSLEHDFNPMRLRDAAGKTLVEFKPYMPSLSFPLSVGKRWRGEYTGFTAFNNLVWDGDTNCKVDAQETLTLAGSDYDTLRIECDNGWHVGPRSGSTHVTRWYAPSIGMVVKEIHVRDPQRWNFELTRFGLPAAVAPPAPAAAETPIAPPVAPSPAPKHDPAAPGILDPNEY